MAQLVVTISCIAGDYLSRNDRINVLVLKYFYNFSKRWFLVLQGFMRNENKISSNAWYTQKNGAVSKVNKDFISYLTRAQRTPSAAATVQVSHALPAVPFSCLLRGSGTSFRDGVAA